MATERNRAETLRAGGAAASTFRGFLDGIDRGWLCGWACDVERPAERLAVTVVVDGKHRRKALANEQRADLLPSCVGDGRYGFRIDICDLLAGSESAIEVSASAGAGHVPLLNSPQKLTVEPAGAVETFRNGTVIGWAHDAWYRPAQIELWSSDRFLLSWPANLPRTDLEQRRMGDGRRGFALPVGAILGGLPPASRLRIAGTDLTLTVPSEAPQEAASGPAGRSGFAGVEEALRAWLLKLGDAGSEVPEGGRQVVLSFQAFQSLLNRLSASGQAAEIAAELQRLCSPKAVAPTSAPAAHIPALAALDERSRAMSDAEILAAAERELVPLYARRNAPRADFEAALGQLATPRVLRAVAKAFRSRDFLKVPALAYERNCALVRKVAASNVRYLRDLRTWAAAYGAREAPLPKPVLQHKTAGRCALYVLWRSVPYDTNGYALRSHYLLRALLGTGHKVVAATRLGYPWDAEKRLDAASWIEDIDGVTYLRLGGRDANRLTVPLDQYIRECAWRIAHVAVLTGASLIHSASNWLAALPALRAARLLGVPFCYEIRGLWEITRASNVAGYEDTDHYELFGRMEAYCARKADLVFVITRQVKEEMQRRGVDGSKMLIAPNGVDVGRFEPQEKDAALGRELGIGDELVFGFIGTFAKYEGLIELCRAADELKRRGLKFRILLVGDGPVYEDVLQTCRNGKLDDVVVATGRVPFQDIPRFYSLVDVAIFPRASVRVTEMVSPLKPFEAMAMGKPVVASNVAALAEIVEHGKTGWLFDKDDPSDLVEVLARLIRKPDIVRDAGNAARAFVTSHHDWSVIARRIGDAWDSLRRSEEHEQPIAKQAANQPRATKSTASFVVLRQGRARVDGPGAAPSRSLRAGRGHAAPAARLSNRRHTAKKG